MHLSKIYPTNFSFFIQESVGPMGDDGGNGDGELAFLDLFRTYGGIIGSIMEVYKRGKTRDVEKFFPGKPLT